MIGRGSIAAGRALLPEKLLEPPSPGRPHQDCSRGGGLLSDEWPWVGWRGLVRVPRVCHGQPAPPHCSGPVCHITCEGTDPRAARTAPNGY